MKQETPMSNPLTITAITRATAGKEQVLRAAQQALVADTLNEHGCMRYELSCSI
jgi:quinol monooxygenase YgiN